MSKLITMLLSRSDQQGSSIIEISILIPLVILLIAGVLDLGRALYYTNVLTHAANASAIYGSQAPSDITGMENMAKADASQVPGADAEASYGCECQDGSQKSADCSTIPACSNGSVYYVTVTASADYTPMVHWPGLGSSFTLSSSSTMRGAE